MLRLRGRECRAPVNLNGVDAKTPELDLNKKTLLAVLVAKSRMPRSLA